MMKRYKTKQVTVILISLGLVLLANRAVLACRPGSAMDQRAMPSHESWTSAPITETVTASEALASSSLPQPRFEDHDGGWPILPHHP